MNAGLPTDRWKICVEDYLESAINLLSSMKENGFDENFPVPIDITGELFNGSHRVACALALEIEQIPVITQAGSVWAPPWNEAWFRQHGASERMICELKREIGLTQ